ncbi:MAG: hypothetical protein K2H02_04780, partial [Anaeroplasmataceae bacterium]|nr:hypothetical protein [Anaeroplasmataceae bacterium]
MLKKKIEELNRNIIIDLEQMNAIVTAGDKRTGYNSLTASWGGIGVLWGMNVAYLFIRKSRYTHQFIEKSDSVTMSFLNQNYKEAKQLIGTVSGKEHDKIKETGLHYTYDPDYDGCYIEEADYCLKLKKIYSIDLSVENLP